MNLLNEIKVPEGIAKNFSLRENTFGIFTCIT